MFMLFSQVKLCVFVHGMTWLQRPPERSTYTEQKVSSTRGGVRVVGAMEERFVSVCACVCVC